MARQSRLGAVEKDPAWLSKVSTQPAEISPRQQNEQQRSKERTKWRRDGQTRRRTKQSVLYKPSSV